MGQMAIISEADVCKYANRSMAYDAIRKAFLTLASGGSALFPVVIGEGAPDESMVAIKSGFLSEDDIVGLKVGTYWPQNILLQKPNHGSTTLLLDPKTGFPMALINANRLNGLRTAAANAIATQLLANPEAKTLLIVGTGHQAKYELEALCDIRSFEQIHVWGRNQNKAKDFVEEVGEHLSCSVAVDLEQATREADVIVTVTTATQPIIESDWVKRGTHISAMGADKIGKQELDPKLFERARLVADYPKQSQEIGEFQHLDSTRNPVVSIGDLLTDSKDNTFDPDRISIFDSSGIALQDISIAFQVYECVRRSNALKIVDF